MGGQKDDDWTSGQTATAWPRGVRCPKCAERASSLWGHGHWAPTKRWDHTPPTRCPSAEGGRLGDADPAGRPAADVRAGPVQDAGATVAHPHHPLPVVGISSKFTAHVPGTGSGSSPVGRLLRRLSGLPGLSGLGRHGFVLTVCTARRSQCWAR